MEKLEEASNLASTLTVERPFSLPGILLGTSSFTASGWQGSFYPRGMQSRDFLSYYATQFATVEVDSTFYGCPSPRTVNNWAPELPRTSYSPSKFRKYVAMPVMLSIAFEGYFWRTASCSLAT